MLVNDMDYTGVNELLSLLSDMRDFDPDLRDDLGALISEYTEEELSEADLEFVSAAAGYKQLMKRISDELK